MAVCSPKSVIFSSWAHRYFPAPLAVWCGHIWSSGQWNTYIMAGASQPKHLRVAMPYPYPSSFCLLDAAGSEGLGGDRYTDRMGLGPRDMAWRGIACHSGTTVWTLTWLRGSYICVWAIINVGSTYSWTNPLQLIQHLECKQLSFSSGTNYRLVDENSFCMTSKKNTWFYIRLEQVKHCASISEYFFHQLNNCMFWATEVKTEGLTSHSQFTRFPGWMPWYLPAVWQTCSLAHQQP